MNMIELWDTFNNRRISSHKSIETAVAARRRHLSAVKRANGASSYLTYEYRQGGERLVGDAVDKAEFEAFEREEIRGRKS